jgi:hypothetical protein
MYVMARKKEISHGKVSWQVQSLAEFFRLQDVNCKATGHKAQKVRVTGYLLWDDDRNGSADAGLRIE